MFFVVYAADLVTTMELVYVMVGFGTLGYVAYPAITMIKSQKCDADEQGRVMGSLSAAMQLANGVGVLFFSHTYAWLIRMHPEPDHTALGYEARSMTECLAQGSVVYYRATTEIPVKV
eukprot:COSAG05_NODE_74_length_21769_cov_194.316290_11_plen_118_part_00